MLLGGGAMNREQQLNNIHRKTYKARKRVLDMTVAVGRGHITSAYSCAEIISVLYYGVMRVDPENPNWSERDRLILSKNHAALMQFPVLAELGYFPVEELKTWNVNGSRLYSHSTLSVPGCDFSGGSLGQGFGVAAGIALVAKFDGSDRLTFCVLGDGELYEGSNWEAAMFAASNELKNLIVIVDRNHLAITDYTEKIVKLEPFAAKFISFGFDVAEVNGHDIGELLDAFSNIRTRESNKPLCVIADTVKGKGIEFIEQVPLMHGNGFKQEQISTAYETLERNYKL
jgi:transketolase